MTQNYFRNIKTYGKIILNTEIFNSSQRVEAQKKLSTLFNELEKKNKDIFWTRKVYNKNENPLLPIPKLFNAVIIDMEGSEPVKLFSVLIHNTIFSCGIISPSIKYFYLTIIRILIILRKVLLFTFSYWDIERIYDIREKMIQDYNVPVSKLRFIDNLKYFNLQEYDRESISAALYSLGEEIPKDPLLRKSYQINRLYEDGFNDMVLQHNYSCFVCESTIFLKRFVKKHLLNTGADLL